MNKSFTLIEILVVIVVIGVLSAFILVGMSSITNSANIAKGQAFSNSIRNSLLINLVAEWKFDCNGTCVSDGSTVTTAYTQDVWGSSNAPTISGTPKVYSGNNCISGSCLYFDGSGHISGTVNPISGQAIYTIEAWINVPAGISGSGRRDIIYFNTAYPAFSPCFMTAYKPLIYLHGNNYKYGTLDLRDNKWHHIVFVVTGSQTVDIDNAKIYVDTKSDGTAPYKVDPPVVPSGVFYIGSTYVGYIDNLRIYNAVIATSKIQQSYFVGINKLLKNNGIALDEFNQRIVELKTNLANNE